jgi:flagellar biosynthetic protein FliR
VQIDLSGDWVIGLALAVVRSAALVASCAFVPRVIPGLGRAILAIALGVLVAVPAGSVSMSSADLFVAVFTNIVIGLVVGWFLGLLAFLFQVGGSIVDMTSGVSLGAVFDPDAGNMPGPFARFYTIAGQTLIIAAGGLTIVAQVLWASTKVVALDGRLSSMGFLGDTATDTVSNLFRSGVELALPVAAVLFVAEVSFGLLSRLAPQVNMFLIALPVKTLMVLSMMGTACVLFPRYADRAIDGGLTTVGRLLGGG